MNMKGPPADDPTSKDVYYFPSTQTVFVTAGQAYAFEWVCVCFLLLFLSLRLGRDGLSLTCYLRPGPRQIVRGVQLAAILALLLGLIVSPFHPLSRYGMTFDF